MRNLRVNSSSRLARRSIVLGVTSLILVVVGALSAGVFASGTNNTPATPPLRATPVGTVDPALAAAYGVLRRSQSASDIPSREDPGAMKEGANLQLARRVAATPGDDVYLAPSSNGACLLSSAGREVGCFALGLLLSGDDAASIICAPSLPAGQIEVYGLLPDGASQARIVLADGSAAPLTVANNFYSYTAPKSASLPVAVEWEADGAPTRVTASVPPDAAGTTCAGPPSSTGVPLQLHPGSPPVQEHTDS